MIVSSGLWILRSHQGIAPTRVANVKSAQLAGSILVRGSTAADSLTMTNPGAYSKTRLPPVLRPTVQEYMRP
jgi:hypothetical protein